MHASESITREVKIGGITKANAVGTFASLMHSTSVCHELFRKYSGKVAEQLGYVVPPYDTAVAAYTEAVMARLAEDDAS